MRREIDIFEKFPDGSTLWRATVLGRFEALQKMQELAEYSENQFFSLIVPAPPLQPKLATNNPQPMFKTATVA